jgi:LytR cell envelope-related transcriptional attenuator
VAGVVLAVVGVVVLIVAVVALRDPRSGGPQNAGRSVSVSDAAGTPSTSAPRTTPKATPTPTRTGTTSAPPVSLGSTSSTAGTGAKSVPLVVLNNTTVAGLAKTAATRFESGGWTVSSSGNFSNDIISTCAYYDPSITGAKAAATALQAQYPTIKRVAPKFDGLPSGPVVVVLTPDYQSS